jgi:ribosomal protein L37AE/L43A
MSILWKGFLIIKNAVKRACVGIWKCSGCKKSMAGGAWEL